MSENGVKDSTQLRKMKWKIKGKWDSLLYLFFRTPIWHKNGVFFENYTSFNLNELLDS